MPFDGKLPPAKRVVLTNISAALAVSMAKINTPEKWCKNRFTSYNGKAHCALGALLHFGPAFDRATMRGAMQFLNRASQARGFACTADFNDDPTTTHAQVMDLMREAYLESLEA